MTHSQAPAARRGHSIRPLAAALLLLAACAAEPPTRFHSLWPEAPDGAAVALGVRPAPLIWEILEVAVPAEVDRPQMVLRWPDGAFSKLEQDRWVAPLADEFRQALTRRVEHDLSATAPAAPAGGEPWRVAVDVQRFDSVPGRHVLLEASWSIRRGGGEPLRCRGAFETPLAAGLEPVFAGQRAVVAQLGDALAAGLRPALGGDTPRCADAPAVRSRR